MWNLSGEECGSVINSSQWGAEGKQSGKGIGTGERGSGSKAMPAHLTTAIDRRLKGSSPESLPLRASSP